MPFMAPERSAAEDADVATKAVGAAHAAAGGLQSSVLTSAATPDASVSMVPLSDEPTVSTIDADAVIALVDFSNADTFSDTSPGDSSSSEESSSELLPNGVRDA